MDEITAEFNTAELLGGEPGPTEPRVRAALSWAARTDIGRVRSHNEDKFDLFLPEDDSTLARRGRLFAVADGMGGHQGGQIASEFALKTLVRAYYASGATSGADTALRAAITDANTLVTRAAEQFGAKNDMGTTLVTAVVRDEMLTIAHVGDSRAYLLREGERPRQLTTDHSWVEEQVKRGTLTREEAELSPYRNVILRSIGMGEGMEADLSSEKLLVGDVIVLASDGLTGYLDGDAIGAVCTGKGLSQAALALIDAANDAGGKDNITALLIRVDDLPLGGEE
ncbi:MAG: protein phosphatase 2C domain-containing protein [Armatimonas sp.]